jgi:predicted DNA repair protein MutK
MASSLFALLDDIATILDDVALMSKVAAKKTAGVLGDDLALNAQQVSGVKPDRELPVVWAVAKGSLKNKCILVPAALAISAFIPWAVIPLLMLGGTYLCYEGIEKIAHKFLHSQEEDAAHHAELTDALLRPEVDMCAVEKEKIQGAIRTDFILSAEIIVITLGTVATAAFGKQVAVLSAIALLMTIGVYGIVAGIVKLDDGGLYLSRKTDAGLFGKLQRRFGNGILKAAPYLMKTLSFAGTAAMFLVGGGIITHGIPAFHQLLEDFLHHLAELAPVVSVFISAIAPTIVDLLIGMVVGAVVLLAVNIFTRVTRTGKKSAA